MKKIIYILPIWFVLQSCDNLLDIKPENTLTETEVFASESLAEGALGDAYYSTFEATKGTVYAFGDFSVGNAAYATSLEALATGSLQADDSDAEYFWTESYSAINICNSLIEKIPIYGQYDEAAENQHIAEAKFLRSLLYYQLLKLYAPDALQNGTDNPGVPLQLTAYDGYTDGDVIPRSTVGEVYTQILKDLNEGYEFLPDDYGNNTDNRSRATKGTAEALLSRIYLGLHDYQNAADYAQKVIERSGMYYLATDLLTLFPAQSDANASNMHAEYIFGYPVSEQTMGYNGLYYYYKTYFWAGDELINLYESDDLRKTDLLFQGYIDPEDPERSAHLTTYKFNGTYSYDNLPVIRLAEIMLTRAEALVETSGLNQESVDLLNDIYLRANPDKTAYATSDFASAEALSERIFLERRMELAFEGHYRYDLLRTGRPLASPDIAEEKYVLPIPLSEVTISNGVIEQNEGY